MKKSILAMTLLVVYLTASECFTVFAAEEKGSRVPVIEQIEVEAEEEEIEEKEYWNELPLMPLGHREPDTDVPDEIWQACVVWGADYRIAPEFLAAIAWRETRWQNIDSADGRYIGVMQIHPGSHHRRMNKLGITDLHDVSSNVRLAADYLIELFEEYEDPTMVLAKYHGEIGDGTHSRYVSDILELSEELERKHGR